MIDDRTDMTDHIEMMAERLVAMARVGTCADDMDAKLAAPYFATMAAMAEDVLDTAKALGMSMRSKP